MSEFQTVVETQETLKNKLIELRHKVISNFLDPQLMFSAFKIESDTNKGYNGRQVLELFQNCDDEDSPEVLIKIDKEHNLFSISNIGTPFSDKGYNSLFYASLSSKVSGKFIGNKGLGFRSIINWADEINIYSNGICLKYAPQFIERAFQELYPEQSKRLELLKERGLVNSVIPLPLLSYPDISEKELNNGYTTTIEIVYKKGFYDDIVKQVESITEETLLFLNNIKKVKFKGFENQSDISITQKVELPINSAIVSPSSCITINDKTWNIVEEIKELDEKYQNAESLNKEAYQLKIAYQDDFSDVVNKLYSYFLTEEELNFPFLIHGTFELDQNRKRVSNDKNENGVSKNEFIFQRLATLIFSTAKYFSKKQINWKPLLFLNYSRTNSSLNVFFDALDRHIIEEELFPCVDKSYKKRDDACYISDSFSQMIQELQLEKYFPNHLIPIGIEEVTLGKYEINRVVSDIISIVNSISNTKLSLENRAIFIYEIVEAFPNKQFDFLIDEQDSTIKASEYIFTPKTGNKDFQKPKGTKIQFLNRELYFKLSNLFNFTTDEKLGRSRFVMQKLSSNCNIHEYEPNRLALSIIKETNDKLKNAGVNQIATIQEMNRCLYYNYINTDDVFNFTKEISVPSLNKKLEVAICRDLYLSTHYPIGKLTEEIFHNIYSDNEYIASPRELGIDILATDFDIQKFQNYLIWINTNSYAKYNIQSLKSSNLNEYIRFVQSYTNSQADYRGYSVTYKEVVNLDKILDKITIEKLLLWLSVDNELELQLSDIHNEDIYKLTFIYNRVDTIPNKPSYIKYRILSKDKFQFYNHLIEDKTEWLNDIKINYESPIFTNYNISKIKINNGLLLLNAKEDFSDLSISFISGLFDKLYDYAKNEKGSQAFYKKVYLHYKKNKKSLTQPVCLFAKSNNMYSLFKQEEVYFSDNIKLPEVLTDRYPMFNYPARSGGSEAIKLFKINDIKQLDTKLNSSKKNEDLSNDFNTVLDKLKPLILSYRLENLSTQKSKEDDASKLKNIIIELCDFVGCSIEQNPFTIDNYEYYYKGNNHYLVAVENKTIEEVLMEPKFADSFAEILSNTFDTSNEKDDFRYLIRNSETYNKHIIEQKFGLSVIDEAKILLGQANEMNTFWKNIYKMKSWNDAGLTKNNYSIALNELQLTSLPNIGYSNINNSENYNILKDLFNKLNIEIPEYNKKAIDRLDLIKFHYKNIEQGILKKSSLIKSSLWKSLENATAEKQANYLTLVGKYEIKEDFINTKSNELKFQFEINIDDIIQSYINDKYLNLIFFTLPNLDEKRVSNLKMFNIEEQLRIESSLKLKSLIYFKSAIEIIREELSKDNEKPKNEISEESQIESSETPNNPVVISSDYLKSKVKTSNDSKSKGVYVPSINNEKRRKEKGNNSEKTILDYFIANSFKEVDPVSKFDEGLHYDIRYTNDDGTVKYVEVKTFDYGCFHMSKSEYDFGFINKRNYEIWLVKDKNIIIPIYDFFTNAKYKTIVNEYLVHLEIETN